MTIEEKIKMGRKRYLDEADKLRDEINKFFKKVFPKDLMLETFGRYAQYRLNNGEFLCFDCYNGYDYYITNKPSDNQAKRRWFNLYNYCPIGTIDDQLAVFEDRIRDLKRVKKDFELVKENAENILEDIMCKKAKKDAIRLEKIDDILSDLEENVRPREIIVNVTIEYV